MAGMSVMERQANAGLKLFSFDDDRLETDTAAAERFKAETDARIAALEAEVAELSGKEHKKERTAKSKQVSELKTDLQYIDACKVAKGLEPKNGYFVTANEKTPSRGKVPPEPSLENLLHEAGQEKKRSSSEQSPGSPGLSTEETSELEQLKKDIVERKAQLRGEGLSSAAQSKDPQIVEWVSRMQAWGVGVPMPQVLKDRQDPGSTQKDAGGRKKESRKSRDGPLSWEEQQELDKLRTDVASHRYRLRTEFGFSHKDIREDEEMRNMEARLSELERREE